MEGALLTHNTRWIGLHHFPLQGILHMSLQQLITYLFERRGNYKYMPESFLYSTRRKEYSMLQIPLLITYTAISPINVCLLLRRPLHVLFHLSEYEKALNVIKRQYFAEAHPFFAKVQRRLTLPEPSLHPVTRKEPITRTSIDVVLIVGILPILLFVYSQRKRTEKRGLEAFG